jgi:serine/threonine protein phosphatase PrpC
MGEIIATLAAKTDVGRVRTTNEDAFVIADVASGNPIDAASQELRQVVPDRGILLALSDGMGGHQAGEVASALVLESLRDALRSDDGVPTERRIELAVQRANANVVEAAKSADKKGMGATLTALLIEGANAYLAQVGDSRAYLLRDGRIRQLSRDQSLVQLLVDGGVMTPEEAKHAPQKNVILQAMGLAADVRTAVARLHLRRGDTVLICCDGLSNALTDEELGSLLVSSTPGDACARAIALANERGGEDNLTVIVARFDGGALSPPEGRITQTFEELAAFVGAPKAAAAPPKAAAAPKPAGPEAASAPKPLPAPRQAAAKPRPASRRYVPIVLGVAVALAALVVFLATRAR